MHQINLSKLNLRTDLIIEKEGIEHTEKSKDGLTITSSYKDGNYITLSFEDITDYHHRIAVSQELEKIIKDLLKTNNIKEDASCLIVGLGNRLSTPDSLGPKVIDDIVITNHLFKLGTVEKGFRPVSALVPGVMANTGIESSLIITSIIKELHPDFVICIDALASMSLDRINKTIQITDTGIHPGSGVGNNRKEISKKTIGIPVIAIGIPTVTTASTIVYDTLNYLYKHISYIKEHENTNKLTFIKKNYRHKLEDITLSDNDKATLLGLFGSLNSQEQRNLINEVLTNTELNLIVTPTEIDFLISKLSNLISSSLNNALHRQINHF